MKFTTEKRTVDKLTIGDLRPGDFFCSVGDSHPCVFIGDIDGYHWWRALDGNGGSGASSDWDVRKLIPLSAGGDGFDPEIVFREV